MSKHISWSIIQLTLIRVYLGLNFTHHYAEKFNLLGQQNYYKVINYFHNLGFDKNLMLLAGIFEFFAFLGLTLGLFTRITALITTIYLVVCLFTGYHHLINFTWASYGYKVINYSKHFIVGGWEFPAFWAFMCFTFLITGGGKYSIDAYLQKSRFKTVRFLSY